MWYICGRSAQKVSRKSLLMFIFCWVAAVGNPRAATLKGTEEQRGGWKTQQSLYYLGQSCLGKDGTMWREDNVSFF